MYLSSEGIIKLVAGFLATALVFGLIGFYIGLEQAEVVYEQLCQVDGFFAGLGYLVAAVVVVVVVIYFVTRSRRW